MDRQIRALYFSALLTVFSASAFGQLAPLPQITPPVPADLNFSDEILPATSGSIGIALKHGNVIPGSETLILDGRELLAGKDYQIDEAQGIIYLSKTGGTANSLEVRYEFDPTGKLVTPSVKINGLDLNLVPGSLNMTIGLGLADRAPDGTVSRMNIFGWNNTFKFRGGSLGGVFMLGNSTTQAGVDNFRSGAYSPVVGENPNDGAQKFILQNLTKSFMGGTLDLGYQTISSNFAGFSQMSGFDANQLTQFQKEKGLTTQTFGLKGAKIGSLSLSDSLRTVTDGKGTLTMRDFGLNNGKFHFDLQSQSLDKAFTRYDDLSDANHADLKVGAGLDKSQITSGFDFKGGNVGFNQFSISDGNGSISRNEGSLDLGNFKLSGGSQKVQKEFTGDANLLVGEKALYSADKGIGRDWVSLDYKPLKSSYDFTTSGLRLQSDLGEYSQFDSTFSGKNFSIEKINIDQSNKFDHLSSLSDPEKDASINSIAKLYGVAANAPAERFTLLGGTGLSRDGYNILAQPIKNLNVAAHTMTVSDLNGGATLNSLLITLPRGTFSYSSEKTESTFTGITNLLGFEKATLGSVAGLDKSNVGLNLQVGKTGHITAAQFIAKTDLGQASQNSIDVLIPGFQLALNSHSVDKGFTNVGQVADPSAAILSALLGKSAINGTFNWVTSKELTLGGTVANTNDSIANTKTNQSEVHLGFNGKNTQVSLQVQDVKNTDPNVPITSHTDQLIKVSQEDGNLKVGVAQETNRFSNDIPASSLTGNAATTVSPVPISYTTNTADVSLKLDKKTSIATEQSRTVSDNGLDISTQTNSVTTELTNHSGITLSDTQVKRPEFQNNNEVHRDYGLWYNLGKGLQLRYGYVRQLDSAGTSTLNSLVSLGNTTSDAQAAQLGQIGQGNLGSIQLGGGYGVNQWTTLGSAPTAPELDRTQAFSNFRLNTLKPFNFGILKSNSVHFSLDSAADSFNWIRDNQVLGGNGEVMGLNWGLEYHSQTDPKGEVAIDRTIAISTNDSQKGKKRFLEGSAVYKLRTLPDDTKTMIRAYKIQMNLTKQLSLSNSLSTNPELPNAVVLLGSTPQPIRQNQFALTLDNDKNSSVQGTWEEDINELTHYSNVTAGFEMSLFKLKGPVTLFYGLQNSVGATTHALAQRWSIGYSQPASLRQRFSFFIGDLNYQYTLPTGQFAHNLTARIDFQLKF